MDNNIKWWNPLAWWAFVVSIVVAILTIVILVTQAMSNHQVQITPPSPSPSKAAVADIALTKGCKEHKTGELFAQRMYECPKQERVYTFANLQARDNWIQAAESVGVVVISKGNAWVRIEDK